MKSMLKAYKINVHGRVQRIGYRRYILDLAQEIGLSGYVKNELDGSVTIFIQGKEENIREFMEKAKNQHHRQK
jgi:acylphosphatase